APQVPSSTVSPRSQPVDASSDGGNEPDEPVLVEVRRGEGCLRKKLNLDKVRSSAVAVSTRHNAELRRIEARIEAEELEHAACLSSSCRVWHENRGMQLRKERIEMFKSYSGAFEVLKRRALDIQDDEYRSYMTGFLNDQLAVVVNSTARAV